MQRYGEVEFLLRSPLKSDDDIGSTSSSWGCYTPRHPKLTHSNAPRPRNLLLPASQRQRRRQRHRDCNSSRPSRTCPKTLVRTVACCCAGCCHSMPARPSPTRAMWRGLVASQAAARGPPSLPTRCVVCRVSCVVCRVSCGVHSSLLTPYPLTLSPHPHPSPSRRRGSAAPSTAAPRRCCWRAPSRCESWYA